MNKNYFDNRNSRGQFSRRLSVARAKDGKFVSPKAKTTPRTLVRGRLYSYKQIPVRLRDFAPEGNKVLVSIHNSIFGYVDSRDLQLMGKAKVNNYLANS